MLKALQHEFANVVIVGPIWSRHIITAYVFIIDVLLRITIRKRFNTMHNSLRSRCYANYLERRLKKTPVDILFAPAASVEIAHLKTETPICYLSDTSFDQIMNYYGSFSNFTIKALKESNQIEQSAIKNSAIQVYSSNWAANHSKSFYRAKKTFTINFGANLDKIPERYEIKKSYDSTINLLFLGNDWERKGGPIVLEAFELLDKKGFDIKLKICGCRPNIKHQKIQIVPFLNKNNKEEMKEFELIMRETHLLFLPTRADCTPIVFCEANAYGIPVITTDTGGVSSLIENDINGYIYPKDVEPDAYANKIEFLIITNQYLKSWQIQQEKSLRMN